MLSISGIEIEEMEEADESNPLEVAAAAAAAATDSSSCFLRACKKHEGLINYRVPTVGVKLINNKLLAVLESEQFK